LPLWSVILLAVVQGIAEFLPVSSSGHVVVLASVLADRESPLGFDLTGLNIVLHFGTLLSILVYYRKQIIRLLGEDRRVIPLLVLGTIPAALIGLTIKQMFPFMLEEPFLAGCLLVVNAGILAWAAQVPVKPGAYLELDTRRTIGIGLAQAVAILPGISRSGATISAGLAAGLTRRDAATFSFLLAIPAIAGASVLEARDLFSQSAMSLPWSHLAIGAAVAFGVGLVSLTVLVRIIETGRLVWFAYWCLTVGVGVICWQLFAWMSN
jgi:undecaprenyl-diphosphatase